jgi:hypothetical protein
LRRVEQFNQTAMFLYLSQCYTHWSAWMAVIMHNQHCQPVFNFISAKIFLKL